jgi:hypothetical protein
MLKVALWSRSCSVLLSGHVHVRTDNGNFVCVDPQAEQRLELGAQRSIATTTLPVWAAL